MSMKLLVKMCGLGQCPAIYLDGRRCIIVGKRRAEMLPAHIELSADEDYVSIPISLLIAAQQILIDKKE